MNCRNYLFSHPHVLLLGDINMDLLKFKVHSGTAEFVDTLLTNDFSPIITVPSRITSRSSTLIDHVYLYPGKNISGEIQT